MFDIYFKVYSEKVWGIPCNRISAGWVDQRINGLSLAKAVKKALFRLNGKAIPTLVDRFLYPELGIGRISDRLREEIEDWDGEVLTDTRVERINHADFRISGAVVTSRSHFRVAYGADFVSSIPVTKLVMMLSPPPPDEILDAAANLRYRDLVVVAVMVNRTRVTDLTWIYIPEKHIPFGRIHEPTNWSRKMSPEGMTLVVAEYFSFVGDRIWAMSDGTLSDLTVRNLVQLGFITEGEVMDSVVVRVPKAYPLFEVGHEQHCEKIYAYLRRFRNLHISGRTGMFRYYNMDHAIESGKRTADLIMKKSSGPSVSGDLEFAARRSGACAAH
jgi:protoporphyrinogen oxidase